MASVAQPKEALSVLSRAWRSLLVTGSVAAGLMSARAPEFSLLILGLPVVLALVVFFGEAILVLFLTAGVYKQDPFLSAVMPIDTTICMMILVALATGIALVRRTVRIPGAAWLFIPIVLAVAMGMSGGSSEYGSEKAVRFCTLTTFAIMASLVLLGERRGMERFLGSLAVIAVILSLYAAQSPTTSGGRLTFQGSNPISFGRIAALSLAFAWLRLHFTRRPFEVALSLFILAISSYAVLAAGSRGPSISILLSMTVISVITSSRHGRSPMSMRLVGLVVLLGALAVAAGSIPALPLYRFQLLFSEDKGASILTRGISFAIAWNLMLTRPLGVGVGDYEKFAILDIRYPHNLLLEIGSELGWVPLLCFVALVARSMYSMVSVLRAEYTWHTLFLAVVLISTFANSMVSGDLNDNRLLFAVLLLPLVYERIQKAELESSRQVADQSSFATKDG